MKKKAHKIKRYGFSGGTGLSRPRKPFVRGLRVLATLAVLLLFALAGWAFYDPVMSLIADLRERPSEAPFSVPLDLPSEPSSSDSPESSPASEPPARTARGIAAAYLPMDRGGDELGPLIEALSEAGMTAVVLDVKDATGTVLYRTENAFALSARAISDRPFDAAEAATRVREAGLTPIARMHAFRDNVAAGASREMAVHYNNTDILWLDNSASLGGRAWLNPYSAKARQYLVDLAVELTEMGFEAVIVDSVQFPSGVALDKAGYGPEAAGVARADILRQFLREMDDAVKAAGGESMLYLSAGATLSADALRYGANPLELASGKLALGVHPGTLPTPTRFGETALANPTADAAATVEAALAYVQTLFDGDIVAMLPAYGADGVSIPQSESAKLREAAERAGASGYILYHPQGSYQLK